MTHILQKAFFRHVLGQWLSQSSLNISSKFLLHQFSIIHSKFSPEEYLVNISMYFKAFIGVIVCIISMCFRRNYILFFRIKYYNVCVAAFGDSSFVWMMENWCRRNLELILRED